jgi:alkylated DNA repair protein (DNA oxidative demethylase)
MRIDVNGCHVLKGYLSRGAQEKIRDDIRSVVREAPLFSPMTPWGKPMSVGISSAGKYGWYTDTKGHRYEQKHPNGTLWPSIPQSVLAVWEDLVSKERDPDCCLINYYKQTAKMGLHQDRDEQDFNWPVLSISLGDTGVFRVGGTTRKDPTERIELESGDVAILGGKARLAYHRIDRIKFGSSTLLKDGGRINLTLRVVD